MVPFVGFKGKPERKFSHAGSPTVVSLMAGLW